MTTRRSFMASILAAGFAPAAIGSGVLMPVRRIVEPLYEDTPLRPGMLGWTRYGYVGLTQADQRALNREKRRLMDNTAVQRRVEAILFPDDDALWTVARPTPLPPRNPYG